MGYSKGVLGILCEYYKCESTGQVAGTAASGQAELAGVFRCTGRTEVHIVLEPEWPSTYVLLTFDMTCGIPYFVRIVFTLR
eukprot:9020735-Heterocapsa_arctica.AAC.1